MGGVREVKSNLRLRPEGRLREIKTRRPGNGVHCCEVFVVLVERADRFVENAALKCWQKTAQLGRMLHLNEHQRSSGIENFYGLHA